MPADQSTNNLVLGGLAAAAVGLVGGAVVYSYLKRDKRKFRPVGEVTKIFVHPIKSCKGLEVNQADCVALGIQWNGVLDRSFVLIDGSGQFVSMRHEPTLAHVVPTVSNDRQSLLVNAPGMPTLTLPLQATDQNEVSHEVSMFRLKMRGADCGPTANEWFCKFLGRTEYRLLRYSETLGGKVLINDSKWGVKTKQHERAVFQNFSQITILGEASLDNLNSRLDKPVQFENFRPNIVVKGPSAYKEDCWKYVRIGKSVMRVTHPCGRCRQTTVDLEKGTFEESGDPLKTLVLYRMASPDDPDKDRFGPAPRLSINVAVENPGGIRLGDVIFASE